MSNQVVARLNAGERKDVIAAALDWPERFARALRLTVDVYLARIAEPGMPLQESQVYFSHAARARAQLAGQESSK